MRIVCPIHGGQLARQCSPDLWMQPLRVETANATVVVQYEWEGQLVDRYDLSAAFAKSHDIAEGTVPLPDIYPNWIDLVLRVCEKCYESKTFHS